MKTLTGYRRHNLYSPTYISVARSFTCNLQRPFVGDAILFYKPIIQQMIKPGANICLDRADNFFGECKSTEGGWRHDLQALPEQETQHQHGPGSKISIRQAKKEAAEKKAKRVERIKAAHDLVQKSVEEMLARLGFDTKSKVSAAVNLVYAGALHPDRPVVKRVLGYLEAKRDADSLSQQVSPTRLTVCSEGA